MLIDGGTIITGSFNFTKAAQESNAENLLILLNKPELYAAYERNFGAHLKHSAAYEGRESREPAPSKSSRGKTSGQRAPAR
jgi:phosphatidylserine/phosphatidylglycerophosphate/cardiolipin synthase-like enzyme